MLRFWHGGASSFHVAQKPILTLISCARSQFRMNVSSMKETIVQRLYSSGQHHILENWDTLSDEEKHSLFDCLQSLNIEHLNKVFEASTSNQDKTPHVIEPVKNITQLKTMTESQIEHWRSIGFQLIAKGQVAVILLAGGQGTRLGSNEPKGCFTVGLPSNKSLFQLHCERVLSIQKLSQKQQNHEIEAPGLVRLYIMTSLQTQDETVEFFHSHNFFGLDTSQVRFFQQGSIPCFTENGKIIMETKLKIAMSPDGNGGIFQALQESGCLDEMEHYGVECVDCFSVDNLLAKAADPVFIGHCWEAQSPCGARVVSKEYPEEKVGVFVLSNGKHQVVEYSELTSELAHCFLPGTNQLMFNWGNICMHYFETSFLRLASNDRSLTYHIAKKQISSKGGTIQGIKLEKFIFDVFQLAEDVTLLEVCKANEFAPVKNAPGSPKDSPETAKQALLTLHRKWAEKAGAKLGQTTEIEISPLVSYDGENLIEHCQSKDFTAHERIYIH